MLAAPAILLAGELVHPRMKQDSAAQLQVLSEQADRQYVAHLLFLVSLVLFVPVLIGLVDRLGDERAAWGHVGAGLGLLGTIVLAAFAGAELVTWQVGKAPAADAAAMTALLDRANESAGILPLFALAAAFPLAFSVLAVGLYLARRAAAWEALLLGVAPIALLVAEFGGAPRIAVGIPAAAFLVGLGSMGLRVLREAQFATEGTSDIPKPVAAGSH
jgi:hypothetical protein